MNTAAHEKSLMAALCRYIAAHCHEPLSLATLSKQAHLSPAHLQRRFKAVVGVSPKEYADACRLKIFKKTLRGKSKVTNAIYDAGFGSASRVYEKVNSRLGMTPKQYRAKGRSAGISYASGKTPLGLVMIGATDRGICFIQFGSSAAALLNDLKREYPSADIAPMGKSHTRPFRVWMKALASYLRGDVGRLDLPLDIQGTAFQMKVWKYLQTIPAGKVKSYTEVASAIKQPRAVRAVARACATNNVAIVIPCHRVIRGDGNLAGYRWGIKRKQALLNLERKARA
ncbi:MAG: bifunctional transcriptional activator/DNA repair enzyme AdaA [Bdellovibrionales bacterium]